MNKPICQRIGFLGLAWACGAGAVEAQVVTPGRYGPTRPAAAALPYRAPGVTYAGPYSGPPVRATAAAYQPSPPNPSPNVPPSTSSTPVTPAAPAGEAPTPASPPGDTAIMDTNRDLALPKAEREEGGGGPTEATAAGEEAKEEAKAEEPPAKDETKLLMNFFNRADAPVKVYGWLENSYTGNTLGQPKNGYNFGVNPNYEANRWMGNQYYLIFENPLEQNDRVNFGFRVDNLFGNDWVFNHMRGLNESSFKLNHFLGYDPAQIYAEVHLPYLTKGGIDIKGGRFYTILGYEVVPAIGRPLLSVPYMFNYGQPFTHFGALSTLHLTDRINVINGLVNGYDRWVNNNYKWNYLGGWTWTSKDTKANFAMSYIWGPNQYPKNLPTNTPIFLLGNSPPGYLAQRRNIAYGGNNRVSFTNVFSYKWTDKLTQVMENDDSYENNVPGFGLAGGSRNASWYSFGNWFLYAFSDKLTAVWRSEVFRDNGGTRTGFSDNFYEQTVGLIYKPKPWLWIRPEARYDWAQFSHPYKDGTKNSQFTIGGDIILLY